MTHVIPKERLLSSLFTGQKKPFTVPPLLPMPMFCYKI